MIRRSKSVAELLGVSADQAKSMTQSRNEYTYRIGEATFQFAYAMA